MKTRDQTRHKNVHKNLIHHPSSRRRVGSRPGWVLSAPIESKISLWAKNVLGFSLCLMFTKNIKDVHQERSKRIVFLHTVYSSLLLHLLAPITENIKQRRQVLFQMNTIAISCVILLAILQSILLIYLKRVNLYLHKRKILFKSFIFSANCTKLDNLACY